MLKQYWEYINDNPKHLWFKRKLYGWGWVPVSWQGWVSILLYVVLVAAFALTIDNNSSPREVAFTFIIPVTLLTISLIRLCYKKGESPAWQWGNKK